MADGTSVTPGLVYLRISVPEEEQWGRGPCVAFWEHLVVGPYMTETRWMIGLIHQSSNVLTCDVLAGEAKNRTSTTAFSLTSFEIMGS